MKFTQRDADIANMLDFGMRYSYIEAKLGVFPAQIARTKEKMRIIRDELGYQVMLGMWQADELKRDQKLRENEFRIILAKQKARDLMVRLKELPK